MQNTEQTFFEKLEKKLIRRGWSLQAISYINKNPDEPVAVRNFLLKDGSTVDYVLFVQGKACAAVFRRDEQNPVKPVYGFNGLIPDYVDLFYFPLPFVLQLCEEEMFLSNALRVNGMLKRIRTFPSPQNIIDLLNDPRD